MTRIGLYNSAGLLVLVRDATGYDPAREAGGLSAAPVPAGYPNNAHWDVGSRSFVAGEDVAQVEAQLISAVKAEGERRKMATMSNGGAKKAEYAGKRAEVMEWDRLGNTATAILTAFNLLPNAIRSNRFAYAIADAAAFGDTVDAAIARFRAGLAISASVPAISAAEAKACAAIRAAGTAAAKRTAAAPFLAS